MIYSEMIGCGGSAGTVGRGWAVVAVVRWSGSFLVALAVASSAVADGVGLPLGELATATLARVDRGGGYRLTVLPPRRRFELLPVTEGLQQAVLLWNDQKAWVPAEAIRRLPQDGALCPERLAVRSSDVRFEPYRNLPPGLRYQWLYKEGAKLHVCTVDLEKNTELELLPYTCALFSSLVDGDERNGTVAELADRFDAVVGINGPFFANGGGETHGEPLGNVIVRGRVAYELTRLDVLARSRSYVAFTDMGRVVLGETNLPASRILELNAGDGFDRRRFEAGERVVSMMGGLGWLVRGGRPDAWIDGVERQFGASYYSHRVRRPQSIVGTSRDGRVVTFLAQEGWPHSRRRLSLPELAVVMKSLGCDDALFNDGGGSTEMVVARSAVVRTEGLGPRRLNSTVLLVLEREMALAAAGRAGVAPPVTLR